MKSCFYIKPQTVFNIKNKRLPLLVFILALFVPQILFSDVKFGWARHYNPSYKSFPKDMVARNGRVYVTGTIEDGLGYKDMATIVYNSAGDLILEKIYNISNCDVGIAIAIDDYNNFYVTGYCAEGVPPDTNIITIKYNAQGDTVWTRRYSGPNRFTDIPVDIMVDAAGNVYVFGGTRIYQSRRYSYLTIKYNAQGNIVWTKTHTEGSYHQWPKAFAIDAAGNVYVTGTCDYNYLTIKYNAQGDTVWTRRYVGPFHNDYAEGIVVDIFNNVCVTGSSQSSNSGFDFATIKYNSSGDVMWIQRYHSGGWNDEYVTAIATDSNGNFCVTGRIHPQYPYTDIVTVKYNQYGELQWAKVHNFGLQEEPRAIATDKFGNVYLACNTLSQVIRTIKYNPQGEIRWMQDYVYGPVKSFPIAISIDKERGNIYVEGYPETHYFPPYITIKYNEVPEILVSSPINITLAQGTEKDTILRIRNTGDMDLNWSLSEVPEVSWLSENQNSGVIAEGDSFDVLLNINSSNLAAGVYQCTLRITSNDPVNPLVNVILNLTVLAPPQISVYPSQLVLTLEVSQTLDTILRINNNGDLILEWSLSEVPNVVWLSENPQSGEIPGSGYNDITIGFNTYNLTAGVYQCTLRITSNDPVNSVLDIPVELTVTARPAQIIVNPQSFNLTLRHNIVFDTVLRITNTGHYPLTWQIAISEDIWWLSVDYNSGEVPPMSYFDVTVSVATSELYYWDSPYWGVLQITSNDSVNPTLDVNIAVNILPPALSVEPTSFNISIPQQSNIDTILQIINTEEHPTDWSLYYTASWLSVYPSAGWIEYQNYVNVLVSFYSIGLSPGVYQDTLELWYSGMVLKIPITFTVTAIPRISIEPTAFNVALLRNTTKDTTLRIYNLGSANLNWELTERPQTSWLSVTPTSGQIPATSYTDLTVSFNTQGLALGVYQCTLRITSNDPQNSVVDVPIQLTVLSGTQRPQISVIPSSITVVLDKNVIRDTSLTITNIGNATLLWNLQKTPDVSWLQVTPISGELLPSNSNNLNVRFITSNLLSWSYQCTLRITSNDPVTPTLDVLVTLIIPGWVRKNDVPSRMLHKLRFVRNGGALVCVGDSLIYAFRGNNSNEFYAYSIAKDSWLTKESIPFGRDSNDTTKISKKKIGKGAALCYDGDSLIYAIRGNNTKQFWKYNIIRNTWSALPFVPVTRGLKGGSGLCYHNGKVYLLAGGQKAVNKNFFVFDVQSATWDTLNSVPLTPDAKTFRDGSGIANINNTIYCLKGNGRHNYFLAYDINQNRWTQKETIPLRHPMLGDKRNRKNKVKDGGAITAGDGIVYIIKGGGKQDFWGYIPATESWIPLDTIPRLPESKKSVPKAGANLTFGYGKVWLIKGNNTFEFWSYTPAI
ncbi:MAG: SBBP repeat-containing protein, partial [candidate division WOR-3 bacterium]|nr:SBBP repeat-containing protein [candidate division WOR-3 bacterium]